MLIHHHLRHRHLNMFRYTMKYCLFSKGRRIQMDVFTITVAITVTPWPALTSPIPFITPTCPHSVELDWNPHHLRSLVPPGWNRQPSPCPQMTFPCCYFMGGFLILFSLSSFPTFFQGTCIPSRHGHPFYPSPHLLLLCKSSRCPRPIASYS